MSAPGRSKYVPEGTEEKELFGSSSNRADSQTVPRVRTLKPPPEIWELVHPVAPPKRSPVMALINRVTSNGTMLMALIFVALAIGGVSAFLIVRPDKMDVKTNVKTSSESRPHPSQTAPTNVAPAALPDNQTQAAERLLAPSSTTSASNVSPAVDSNSPSSDNGSTTPAATERKKIKTPTKLLPASEYAVAERVGANAASSQPVMDRTADAKKSPEPTAPKVKANANPQLIAPAKPSESSKAKVIQWP